MSEENVKVCGGILLVRSDSGTSKIEKVLVETKPGKTKGQVKCRLQKFVKDNLRPSRIPVPIKPRKKCRNASIVNIPEAVFVDPASKGDWKRDKDEDTTPGGWQYGTFLPEPKVELLYESENKDSSLHVNFPDDDDFEDDDDQCSSLTKFQEYNIQKSEAPTIVMAQFSSQYSSSIYRSSKSQDLPPSQEDFVIIEPSSDSSLVIVERYIDSGLRRLKSQESRLALTNLIYKNKRVPPTEGDEDDVEPLLQEIPSDIFQPHRVSTRTRSRMIKSPTQPDSDSYNSIGDEESKTPSEASEIDTGPLDKLKGLEDKTFVISAGGLIDDEVRGRSFQDKDISRHSELIRRPDRDTSRLSTISVPSGGIPARTRSRDSGQIRGRSISGHPDVSLPMVGPVGTSSGVIPVLRKLPTPSKKDFCIHSEDIPEDDFCIHSKEVPSGTSFSSISLRSQRSKKSTLFQSKDEFCIHTRDPARSSRYSSTSFNYADRRSQDSRTSTQRNRSSIRAIHPSKSQGFSTISLIDNKEARRSKYSQGKKSKNW